MDGYRLTPLAGGFSGETFLGEAGGESTVVRVYAGRGAARGPDAALMDAAVLSLVRGLAPVPTVLEVRRSTEETPAVLVTSLLAGERLDLVLGELPSTSRTALGSNLGTILGRLAVVAMPRAGLFADPGLTIEPFTLDLVEWVDVHPPDWPGPELVALRGVAAQAQGLLDRHERVSLVHGDFNPKNLLVDRGTAEVTGVLDWEFAHAGSPYADLGNLLRFERDPVLASAVLAAFEAIVPAAPAPTLDLARAADLFALVELAARRGENPVTVRADELLRAIARSGDLHAVPPMRPH